MRQDFKKPEFLAKINQGDCEAFLQAYGYYLPKIFNHAYYRVNCRATAEDISQQTFLKTWQYLAEAESPIANLNAFLYKTANNLIIDFYRKAERKNIGLNDEVDKKSAVEPSYIGEVERGLEIEAVKTALLKLSDEHKKLITWRYLDEMSIAEISKICNQPPNNIYVGLHRALKELKKIIA
jgi:RNA polymerase sigma-70 factor (ECF subfamily)